jgi:hypothetical protein
VESDVSRLKSPIKVGDLLEFTHEMDIYHLVTTASYAEIGKDIEYLKHSYVSRIGNPIILLGFVREGDLVKDASPNIILAKMMDPLVKDVFFIRATTFFYHEKYEDGLKRSFHTLEFLFKRL